MAKTYEAHVEALCLLMLFLPTWREDEKFYQTYSSIPDTELSHSHSKAKQILGMTEEFFPNVMCFISERHRPRTQDFQLSSRNSMLGTFFSPFFWPQGMWDPSSPTRDWAHALCIEGWNHWATSEVHLLCTLLKFYPFIRILIENSI